MDPSACFTALHHTVAPKVHSAALRHAEPLPHGQASSSQSSPNSHMKALAFTGSVAALSRHLHRHRRSRTRVQAVGPVVAAAAAAAKVAAAGKYVAAGAGAASVAAGIKTLSEGRRGRVVGWGGELRGS